MIEIAEKYGFLTKALQFLGRPGNIGKIMDLADNLLPRLHLGCQIHDGMGAIAYCAVADDISVLEELHTRIRCCLRRDTSKETGSQMLLAVDDL